MNPSANAFVPRKGSNPTPLAKSNLSTIQDGATAAAAAAGAVRTPTTPPTRLSATAAPFVPPMKKQNAPSSTADGESKHADPVSPASPPEPEPSAASLHAASGTEPTPLEAASASDAQESQRLLDEVPAPRPQDWAKSKLPALFGCHNTKAKATSEPIRLNNAWDLYADDNGGGTSTPLAAGGAGAGGGGGDEQGGGANPLDPIFVHSVSDVESFWRLWRYLPPPSSCPTPFTYSWFRHDVRPEWEHPRNKRGGTVTIVVFDRDKAGLNDKHILDEVWMATLVGAAGESFVDSATTLNGVMLKVRPNNRPVTLQLWTAHSESARLRAFLNSYRDAIGKVMGTKSLQKLEFYSHSQKQSVANTLASRMKVKPKMTPDLTF